MSLRTASHRTALCKSTSLLYAVLSLLPAMAQGAAWNFDSAYGSASVMALPGGQVTLVHDGAGQQARTVTYLPVDGVAPSVITLAYGPGNRKTIETENGTPRLHVYGIGQAPILRTESDGGLTYQVGLETISVPASGTATVAHRVLDLKESTVAVLDSQAQCGQRVSYTSYGSMQAESATVTPCSTTVLLGGYEGLPPWLLGTDQIVDNRARLYDPASARFLALDDAGQAMAYEARANNPVSRVDVDGNANFDRLLEALKGDQKFAIAFGGNYGGDSIVDGLNELVLGMKRQKIDYRVSQEAGLLTEGLSEWKVLQRRFQDRQIAKNKNIKEKIRDLNPLPDFIAGEEAQKLKTAFLPILPDTTYLLFRQRHENWHRDIFDQIHTTRSRIYQYVFFVDANYLQDPDRIYRGSGKNRSFRYTERRRHQNGFGGCCFRDEEHIAKVSDDVVSLSPVSSFGLQSRYENHLITIVHPSFADLVGKNPNVLYTQEETQSGLFTVGIPIKLLANNYKLADLYSDELLSYYGYEVASRPAPSINMNEENNENDGKEEEKAEEEPQRMPLPISVKPKNELSLKSEFSEK